MGVVHKYKLSPKSVTRDRLQPFEAAWSEGRDSEEADRDFLAKLEERGDSAK
jgi:hypothetical protein